MTAIRRWMRIIVPERLRRGARRLVTELPLRLRDAIPDALDATFRRSHALPPARLRRRVGRTSSRREFTHVGAISAEAIRRAWASDGRLLDFGCGPGRVARVLAPQFKTFTGVDVDRDAVVWCQKHLIGTYAVIDRLPPLRFADASFDLVYAISIFTHFDETTQDAWLDELRRVIAPNGILFATTHAPDLQFDRPDLTHDVRLQLAQRGFAFAPGRDRFNEGSAFHAEAYLRHHWNKWFSLVAFQRFGLGNFQDVIVLQR